MVTKWRGATHGFKSFIEGIAIYAAKTMFSVVNKVQIKGDEYRNDLLFTIQKII
ncbi:hypothetical protein [Lysinibacillus sp. Bpr_S20]|uniref:hypothetical protein n=1 Tax=Lysinibacillus sp. Bpr_S20 TaxID=2933964 RepID=UPI002011A708|nr:hypothetical protein [Lysinibacillus sp. Bpr_S20]MCL1699072.1 hypothetical protein [Lysinibacillus sp. Bpr_S20]